MTTPKLLIGAAGMTFVAAFIEAFWSSHGFLPFGLKIGVGIGLWVLLALYFGFVGRSKRIGAAR